MNKLAYWISLIFGNPVFVLIIYLLLNATGLSTRDHVLFSYIFWTLQVLIPGGFLFWALRTGRIKDIDITRREERFELLSIIFVGNTLSLAAIWLYGPMHLFHLFSGVYLVFVAVYLITFFWKISLHMTLNTMMVVLLIVLLGKAYWISAGLLPIVAWSRYQLHKHTPMQLIAGTAVPACILLGIYSYLEYL